MTVETKMKSLPCVLVVVGLVAGFGLGRLSLSKKTDGVSGDENIEGRNRSKFTERSMGGRDRLGSVRGIGELRRAMDDSDPVASMRRFSEILEEMTSAEAAEAAKVLWAEPGTSRELAERKRLLAYRWGQVDGANAIAFAEAQKPGQGKVTAISGALAGWASVDPAAAKAFIEAEVSPGLRALYDVALVNGWARVDPGAATNHVLGMNDGPNTTRTMRLLASEQVRQDPEAAGPWALGLPEGGLKAVAINEVATRRVWSDAPAAIDWVASIDSLSAMPEAMTTAMGVWARTNPVAAGEYLNEMPNGGARDHAVGAFSLGAAAEDPERSAMWAGTISDEVLREESLVAVGRTWLRQDRESAESWLAGSGLSAAALARIRSSGP